MDPLSALSQAVTQPAMQIPPAEVVMAVLLSTALMAVIAAVYKHTHSGQFYSQGYAHTLVLMGALITVVIMVIGDNGGRALAVFGVFSFIRFRNLLPETRDVAYLFFAMVVGLTVGAQQYVMAVATTVIVSGVGLALWRTDSYAADRTSHILRVRVTNDIDFDQAFSALFERLLERSELMSIESVQAGMLTELHYAVRLKPEALPGELVGEVQRINGNNRVVLQAFGPNVNDLRQADFAD
jgi:hypothetical protein